MRFVLSLALLAIMPVTSAVAQTIKYEEGQVWEYRTRPGDEGSLLKIQRIETNPTGNPIFHISVIGIRLVRKDVASFLPHEPVSQNSLDISVTQIHRGKAEFPSADGGIAEWQRANGGVFTISIADTIDVLDKTLSQQPAN